MARRAENVAAFYNKRGTCEQWIKEGKGAIKWTRLACRSFAANAVRLQLHALAYNPGNFMRTLATPEPISDWSMTTLREKLIKIGATVVGHARYVAFQMAEVAISRHLFAEILRLIADLRPQPITSTAQCVPMLRVQSKTWGEVRLDEGEFGNFPAHQPKPAPAQGPNAGRRRNPLVEIRQSRQVLVRTGVYLGNVGFVCSDSTLAVGKPAST